MVVLVPGALAFVFGWFAFRSRVTGVYLSIITQALTFALLLAFFRNDMGFGGNNGLTDFKDILGFDIQANGTRAGLFAASAVALALGFAACAFIVGSRTGKVLVAIRDAESRTRFCGYRVEHFKLFVWTFSAMLAGIGGALYVPQAGIINPGEFAPGELDRGGHLGRVRRPRHLVGRHHRRPRRQRDQVLADRQLSRDLALRAGYPVHRHHPVHAQGHRRPPHRPLAEAPGGRRAWHPRSRPARGRRDERRHRDRP